MDYYPKRRDFRAFVVRRPHRASLVAALLGVVSTLTYAPFGLWFLAPLPVFGMLILFLFAAPKRAFRYGFCYGVGLFLSGTYWIYVSVHVFGQAPLVIALLLMLGLVVIMALYLGAAGWAIARLAGASVWRLALAAPAVWVLVEWFRGWFLSGFPWLSLGYSQIDSPLAGWAPVIGIYGISWMLLVATVALVLLVFDRQRRLAATVLVILPWLCGSLLLRAEWTEPYGDTVATRLVQGGVSQDRKWLPEQFRPTLELYRNALIDAAASELVIWPEVAIPAVASRVTPYLDLLQEDVARRGQTLALGILEPREDGTQVYNSVLMLDGRTVQSYRKRHLVPFGEYFPVPDFVREWLRLLSLPNTDMAAGADEQPLLVAANGIEMTAAICYEDAYGAEQLYALPDAKLLINVSNDAWFGDSIAPHQHLEVARMRALETGRPIVRATNNGISVFIDHRGRVTDRAPQFEFAVLDGGVQPRNGLTPYAATGNWPLLLLLMAVLAYSARSRGT